eukprot:12914851-Prorocentrum_lima.AAC.1
MAEGPSPVIEKSIKETFEENLRNSVPLRFMMAQYEQLELDDPKRCYHYLEQQVIKFLDIRRLNHDRAELENA